MLDYALQLGLIKNISKGIGQLQQTKKGFKISNQILI
ncbi:hypothetical protein E9M_04996 [Moraxella catarrhalis 46P47B1]|nr:hypothetical protein E9M_04996 [Moraxella catarrhalis 46P47B1]EGE14325.1 hypothetical protein E9O_07173 [Moraxella catarrhalis 12P80B1]EGE19170.1 hypothetical protein E9U_07973 [Moraxella catarrhalis BC8]EGE21694.1 hypothetical protein E9S_03659 [Moraxella catarrhalis BC7]EGE26245.1 hypothetical protein E9W_00740 [Moraxella catarrhalis CO72]